MTAELYGFTLLLRIQSMIQDNYDPTFDYLVADIPAAPETITYAFNSQPLCRRVRADGRFCTRAEWAAERAKSNGNHVDLMK